MNSSKLFILALIILTSVSCEKLAMHPKPNTDNLAIFNEYSQLCIEKYGLAEVRDVNLEMLADSLRPFITADLSEEELFNLMGLFVDRMQEGHTNLGTVDNSLNKSYFGWALGYPLGIKTWITDLHYYGIEANPNVQIIEPAGSLFVIKYGFLPQDNQIGYIRIPTFLMDITDEQISAMMEYLKDTKGLIIDVRANLGGYIELGANTASYFTEAEFEVGTNYIKNGPGKDDFAASKMKIKPSGSAYSYTKPVVVLQDRTSFSTGALFCMMMRPLSNVKTMGIPFGGGTGHIMDGFLANGWSWTISTSNFVDIDGRPTDPGIDVDIPMLLSPADTATDAIIERAILELQ